MNRICLLLAAAVTVTSLSCRKSSHGDTTSDNCRITAMKISDGTYTDTYAFDYTGDGKISTVHFSDSSSNSVTWVRNITYSQNLIVAITTINNKVSTDSVFLNSGQVAAIITHNTAGVIYNYTFTRDSNGQLVKSTMQYNGGSVLTTSYQYTNGDITEEDLANAKYTLTYYADKKTMTGDMWPLAQLIQYGAVYMQNVHMVQTQNAGGTAQAYNYTFDASGKITSVKIVAGNYVATVQYTYQCN